MNSNFERNLEKYAEVAVKVGLNVQPGQRVLIGIPVLFIYGAPPELAPLIHKITIAAYKAGASLVDVIWDDPQIRRIRIQHGNASDMIPSWPYDETLKATQNGDAILMIYAQDPNLLADLDPQAAAQMQQKMFEYSGPTWKLIGEGATNWSCISAPVDGWTQSVYPDLQQDEATNTFWDAIFSMCRVYADDPVAAWEAHIKQLARRSDYLNNKRYSALKYTAPGTDLTVGLPVGHTWHSGSLTTQKGTVFVANIPTEEVFTLADCRRIEGTVRSTKPLSYEGTLVEDFSLTFEGGRVVKAAAAKGEAQLNNMLNTDDGARSLGEVALVPHSSPISQTGRLFYNVVIDENASCHLALGAAYKFTMDGGPVLSDEEFNAAGGNLSLIHTDFMMGSEKLDIDGITADGSAEAVMRQGEWAFKV